MNLQQLAETLDDPRAAILLFIAAHSPVASETVLACYGGEAKRVRVYVTDLIFEGSITRNLAGAFVYLGWHRPPRRKFPRFVQIPIAFGDDLANAMSANADCGLRIADSGAAPHNPNSAIANQQLVRAPVPGAHVGTPAPVFEFESSRIDPDPSHSTRLEIEGKPNFGSISGFGENPHSAIRTPQSSARSYIEEKLCLPRLQRLRMEVTGGNAHMARKFAAMLARDPDQLAEWIGEAATPAIEQPCLFLNARMTDHLRTYA